MYTAKPTPFLPATGVVGGVWFLNGPLSLLVLLFAVLAFITIVSIVRHKYLRPKDSSATM